MKACEQDVAAKVVAWLQEQRWDVYQEVATRQGGRCDIVAKQGPILWAIEVKTTLGIAVMTQADHWVGKAHLVSCATPSWPSQFVRSIATFRGFGLLRVHEFGRAITEEVRPRLSRRIERTLIANLCDEQKWWSPAGNAGSDYFSPWKRTCRQVTEFVRRRPGCTMRELVDGIDHHYASGTSARCHLRRWIEAGTIDGVTLRRDGRRLFVDPVAP